jgi:hypothetical protein
VSSVVRRFIALSAVLWLLWALGPAAPVSHADDAGRDLQSLAALATLPPAAPLPERSPEPAPLPTLPTHEARSGARLAHHPAVAQRRALPDLRNHVRRLHRRRAAPRQDEPDPSLG